MSTSVVQTHQTHYGTAVTTHQQTHTGWGPLQAQTNTVRGQAQWRPLEAPRTEWTAPPQQSSWTTQTTRQNPVRGQAQWRPLEAPRAQWPTPDVQPAAPPQQQTFNYSYQMPNAMEGNQSGTIHVPYSASQQVAPAAPSGPFQARMHWKADSSTSVCGVCSKAFHFFRRRHHCRQCGEVVCYACSKSRQATFIPGCETVSVVRVCSLCVVKRSCNDFSWEQELARYFGAEVARRGAHLLNTRWNATQATVSGVAVTVHRFEDDDDDEEDEAVIGAPSAARPHKSQAAFWVRQSTPSSNHLTTATPRSGSPRKSRVETQSVVEMGECPICQFELNEAAGVEDFTMPKNVDPSHSLGTDPDAIVTINQCGHNFHAACVGKWLKDHTTCPMCRENAFNGVKGAKKK